MTPHLPKTLLALCASVSICALSSCLQADTMEASLSINADTIEQKADRHRLTGTNISLWSRVAIVEDQAFQDYISDWHPATIRMPGGSWSNEYYWNGNGVRIGPEHEPENFDTSKQNADGTWEVDYSGYAPGFRLHGEARHLSDYHGDLDVRTQHEWINNLDAKAMVTVNVGSGTPQIAAEWVKWAYLTNDYGVRQWEIGNELNGDWELGHRLPDGSSMNGTVYAERFLDFSKAMRAVDSTVQLGGPASSDLGLDFVEELIRDSGDSLDFVSFHAYPVGVNTRDSSKKFTAIDELRDAVYRIDQWIETYQPARKDEIEIGITEWNIKVNEDRDTADLINGLWSALWIGALFEEGVDFANQWDLTTYVEEGGHSAFYIDEATTTVIPKSQYWALWMWNNLMGNELVASKIKGTDQLQSFVTKSENGLQVMLVNTSETDAARLTLKLESQQRPQLIGIQHTFSQAEYFWDPHAHKPLWSQKPTQKKLHFDKSRLIHVPAFSICVVQLAWNDAPALPYTPATRAHEPELKILLPERAPADRPIEGWLVATDSNKRLPLLNVDNPTLSIEGPASIDHSTLKLINGAAHFTLTPHGAGQVQITAKNRHFNTTQSIELVALSERTQVNWTFDNPSPEWQVDSTYKLSADPSIKPNQYVAAAHIENQLPGKDADQLFHFEPLPREQLPFKNAVGVIGQLRAAHNLKCADPKAKINIILQSDANHWMPLGSVQLSDIIGKWQDFEFKATKPEHLDAMGKLYSIRIQIQALAPITGDIYLDDLGFIFRTGL